MKKYSTKWITQRITALLLVPLFFWFIYHCISFQNLSYKEIVNFFSSFINSFLFLVLMITMLIHSQLGCETIIEDYISSGNYNEIDNIDCLKISYPEFLDTLKKIIR